MQHHDRRTGGIARAEFDDVKAGACNLDHGTWRGMGPLHQQHAGLRDQRQNHQRSHDNHRHHGKSLNDLSHQ